MTAKNKNKRPTGLPNLGNSCYLNSVVQSLRTLKTFKIYLSSCKISKNNLLEKKLIDQLKKLLIEPSKSQINGLFAILAKRSFFSPFVQEDAHEFLSFVLSLFPENNPFVGKLVHCNYCRQCDYYSDFRQEIFQSISLDMSFNSVFSGYKGTLFNHNDDSICEPNLRDLLQNYFKGGISDFSCKNCLSKNKIKEFEFDLFEMEGHRSPLDENIFDQLGYPLINPFVFKSEQNESERFLEYKNLQMLLKFYKTKFGNVKSKHLTVTTPAKIERIPKILCLHLSRGLQNAKSNKFVKFDAIISDDYYPFSYDFKFKYVLSAVIEHRGFLFEGHYIAYVKNNNNWYKCSDSKIEYSNIDEVLRTQAYILFYEYESH